MQTTGSSPVAPPTFRWWSRQNAAALLVPLTSELALIPPGRDNVQ